MRRVLEATDTKLVLLLMALRKAEICDSIFTTGTWDSEGSYYAEKCLLIFIDVLRMINWKFPVLVRDRCKYISVFCALIETIERPCPLCCALFVILELSYNLFVLNKELDNVISILSHQ